MKLTILERLGNFVSQGAVVAAKLDAMNARLDRTECRSLANKSRGDAAVYLNALSHANAHLRNIAEMGTPNMASIGKRMQAEAIKGLTQPKYTG